MAALGQIRDVEDQMRHSMTLAIALGVILAAPIGAEASDTVTAGHKDRSHAHRIVKPAIPATATALGPLTLFAPVGPAANRDNRNEVYEPEPLSHYWR